MKKLTTICAAFVLLGGVVGAAECGGSQRESAYRKEAARFFVSECRYAISTHSTAVKKRRNCANNRLGAGRTSRRRNLLPA